MTPSPQDFATARRREEETGRPQYVVRDVSRGKYVIQERMPMVGEWYATDELRHG